MKTMAKLYLVITIIIIALIYFRSSEASYFVPYDQIQRSQAITNQINQQTMWGDYPGGENSSLSSYTAPTEINMNNNNNNYNQQAQNTQNGYDSTQFGYNQGGY